MSVEIARLKEALAGRYAVDREIGRGGMATVFLAEDVKHSRKVALKVLRPELAESVGADRFLHEIRTTANLRHPHIVPLFDSGEASGFLYYVMPYVEGESLAECLERERLLGVDESIKITRQVADALAYAHQRGLLHRDIKPGNIMLEHGHAVVTDFGVARAVSAAGGDRLTSAGLAVGTPAYMSPEQAAGDDRLDERSDLYSLACVTYEMLAGQPPFTGPTPAAVMARHRLDPAPPLGTVRPGLPAHVERAVEKALAKIPADRFTSMPEWASALETADAAKLDARSKDGPAAAGTRVRDAGSDPGRGRPELSIAVLPIRGAAEDAELVALAEGLTEEITAGLTRFTYLNVVGGGDGSAGDTDPRGIARDLGARYLLTGRVRRAGKIVRVSVRLIDAEPATSLWAESYDADLDASSLFDIQDFFTDRIVATVADQHGVLIREMSASVRDKPIDAMSALDAVFLTFDYWQLITPDAHLRTRAALERAVKLEPGSADAWACLSMMYCEEVKHDYNKGPDSIDRALDAARRAVDLDRACQHAYYALAQAYFFRGDMGRFRSVAEKGVQINPRDGNTVAFMGILMGYAGDTERGTELIRRVLELNPHHPGWYLFGFFYDHMKNGRYEEALATAQAINLPGYYPTHVSIAAAAALAGRMDVAREAVRELAAVCPGFAEWGRDNYRRWVPDEDIRELIFRGLETAGLKVASEQLAEDPTPAPEG